MKKKLSLLLLAVVLVSVAVTGGAWAILHAEGNPVINSFVLKPDIQIEETFQDDVKSEVKVKVVSSAEDLAIRAKIVVTYQDEDGNVLAQQPVLGTDYTMTLNTVAENANAKWKLYSDGFYHYKDFVKSGESTDALIVECKPVAGETPVGYGLCVDVLAQGLDADGVNDVWKWIE